jgi:hypothetical protein
MEYFCEYNWDYEYIWLINGKSVGMMKFPTEWKVIKFHGSKPPTSNNNGQIS